MFGEGISYAGEIIDLGVETNVIKKWFLVQLWRHQIAQEEMPQKSVL